MIWKKVKDTSDYLISNNGSIKRISTGNILKPGIDKYGYPRLTLINTKGKKIYRTIHKMVAMSFKDNPNNLPQVNHEDGDKFNNNESNLKWCTSKYNIIHSYETGLNKNTTPVLLLNTDTGEETRFRSIKELSGFLNIFSSVLMPLILNSSKNKILNKYVITINDLSLISNTSNTKNFGRTVYVLDLINNKHVKYDSILLTAFFTGLRNLGNIKKHGTINKIGYIVSFKPILNNTVLNKNELNKLRKLRKIYINTPYVKRSDKYFLIDYYSKNEKVFDSLTKLTNWINDNNRMKLKISSDIISYRISNSKKKNKSAVALGYGVKNSDLEWTTYSEEFILNSVYDHRFFKRAYKLIDDDNNEMIIFGNPKLCFVLGIKLTKKLLNANLKEIKKLINNPDILLIRLNNKIKI